MYIFLIKKISYILLNKLPGTTDPEKIDLYDYTAGMDKLQLVGHMQPVPCGPQEPLSIKVNKKIINTCTWIETKFFWF